MVSKAIHEVLKAIHDETYGKFSKRISREISDKNFSKISWRIPGKIDEGI